MSQTSCCGTGSKAGTNDGYEVVRIEKAKNNCHLCDYYADRQKTKPVAVMCCEGACLRGEIARQAANILCYSLAPEKTVRICLGGAFTKDTGQRNLVRKATQLIALEGCFVNCSSRMMNGVLNGLKPEVIIADKLYEFDRRLFGVEEMSPDEIQAHALTVARKIAVRYDIGEKASQEVPSELNYREWIEAIDAPLLLMQGNPRQVITANRRALELFEKELGEVEGRRGGQVFDCIYASTEDGCGKDSNCEGCKIRDGIIDTFTTGKSHIGIFTSLQIKKATGTITYVLQVSTEKVGDLALVRIERFDKA
ncbi:MAG: putative zinc-binding protein [Desulfuromonadaceae bacterium]|nr:putative zinc-binding protein [Desulfuromonadaceae bacterium]MDD5107737.1 putative zinc-binding protein [Desulfuromonadaceae bacterium]